MASPQTSSAPDPGPAARELRRLRVGAGLSQRELAHRLGVARSTLAVAEAGRRVGYALPASLEAARRLLCPAPGHGLGIGPSPAAAPPDGALFAGPRLDGHEAHHAASVLERRGWRAEAVGLVQGVALVEVRDLTRRPHPLVAVIRTQADLDCFLRDHPRRRRSAPRRSDAPCGRHDSSERCSR